VVQRCIESDPADRWQAASDIRKELEWAATAPSNAPRTAARPSRVSWIVAAAACAALLVALSALLLRESPTDLGPSEFSIAFDQTTGPNVPVPSPDGRSFVFFGTSPGEGSSLWIRRLESVEARRLPGTEGAEGAVIWSPDTKWIAYSSNESGRSEVYVRPFSGKPADPTGKIQISDKGGEYPVWSPSGKEIFYMDGDATIFAVDSTNLGRADTLPAPARLFQACPGTRAANMPLTGNPFGYSFDTRDGQRFLLNCVAQPPGEFTIRINWRFGN
jgi:hypothetical protein